MRSAPGIMAAVALLAATASGSLRAAELSETFGGGWPSYNPFTNFTYNGWAGRDARVGGENYDFNTNGAVWLSAGSDEPWLRTPLLANGFGTVAFDTANQFSSGEIVFHLEKAASTNGPWTRLATYTNTLGSRTWAPWSYSTAPVYDDVVLRLVGVKPSGSTMHLGIDNVRVTEPPAKVDFGSPYTDPATVHVNQSPHIFCPITPSHLASNIQARVVYSSPFGSGTNDMAWQSGTLYRTVDPLPAFGTEGMTVTFSVEAAFEGTNALSPAAITSSYVVAGIDFDTGYEINSMKVTGDGDADMMLVDHYLWQGVLALPAPLAQAAFRFQAVRTDNGTTNTWGDAAPVSPTLIARGAATLDAPAITIGPLPAGQIGFLFNEDTGDYVITDVAFQDFEAWTGAGTPGTHTNNGWIVAGGQLIEGGDSRIRGTRSALLDPAGGPGASFLRGPAQASGIGTLSFWSRHESPDAQPPVNALVQVSVTGGTPADEWTTIETIPVISPAYNRFVVPFSNPFFRHARLLLDASGDKGAMVDDAMFAAPGAGVLMSNLVHHPASPAASNSVSVSVNLSPVRGAVVENLTAWWRSGSSGAFNPLSMVETSPGLWTVAANIPPAQGDGPDGLGAGRVEYYLTAHFSGYQAELASPLDYPATGPADPAFFDIQPASITYADVSLVPSAPVAGGTFDVIAEILPVAGAGAISPALRYRHGLSGPFSEIYMIAQGTNRFKTVSAVPVPAHPGSPIQYYISSFFEGPSALSPGFHPAGSPSTPSTVLARAAEPLSDFTAMNVTGADFTGPLRLTGDHRWQGVVSLAAPANDPSFSIQGVAGAGSATWGDDTPPGSLPFYGTAAIGEDPIAVAGSHSNHFVLVFNESDGRYRLQAAHYQDFSPFTPSESFTPGAPVVQDGWTLLNATVFNTNGAFSGNTLRLGGTAAAGTNCYVQSPVLQGGIGNISFWYRNLDAATGSQPGQLDVLVRSGGGAWQTVGSITNILTPDYLLAELLFASDADAIEVRVQWDAAANPELAHIALDDLVIEHLGVFVNVSDPVHAPPDPVVADLVTIEAGMTPLNGATNLVATAWYRIGTNGTFAAAAMTNTTGYLFATDPPLPRNEPGTVQYYVQTWFESPHGDGPFTILTPPAGPLGPNAYTNTDALAAFTGFQASEGWAWTAATLWETRQTNAADWIVNNGQVRGTNYINEAEAAWLNAGQIADSYIQTPWLPYGAGALSLDNRIVVGGQNATYEIQVSTNGTTWATLASLTHATNVWQNKTMLVDIELPLALRFASISASTLNAHLGFDNIQVSYPLANAAISDVTFHPLYPSESDHVRIACSIASITTFAPALDISAEVYYKASTATNFQGPVAMSRNGSAFTTVAPGIPPFPGGTTVEYYIRSTFKGYNRLYSHTPLTSPANIATDTLHRFTSRRFASSYNTMRTEAGEDAEAALTQTGDGFWQGVLNFLEPVATPSFTIMGYDFYNGTNLVGGLATTWGDDHQSRTNVPIAGKALVGGGPIPIPETVLGQYMLRFNEQTGDYSLQRVAFQDFDTWPASDSLFEESYAAAQIKQYPQAFDNTTYWPVSVPYPMPADFEIGWEDDVQTYPPTTFPAEVISEGEGGFYTAYHTAIITQLAGQAAMMRSDQFSGTIQSLVPDSLGAFSFEARCANPYVFEPSIVYTNLNTTNVLIVSQLRTHDQPVNSSGNSRGVSFKSLIAGYADTNNFYEARMVQTGANSKQLELWQRINGSYSRRSTYVINSSITTDEKIAMLIYRTGVTNVRIRVFHDATSRIDTGSTPIPAISNGFGFGFHGRDATVSGNSVEVFAATNHTINYTATISTAPLYSEFFTNGVPAAWSNPGNVWSVVDNRLRRPGYTGDRLGFTVDFSTDQINWNPVLARTNLNHSTYQRYEVFPHIATSGVVRIQHTTGNGHLIVDNILSTSWRGKTFSGENWLATNAWVTTGRSARGLELRGSRALAGQLQYVQSPAVTGGVAIVSFDYLSVTGTSNQMVFALDYTLTNAPTTWLTLLAVTNNPVAWTTFSHSIEREMRPSIRRVRIRNASTDPAAGILLDNIMITEPAPVDDFTWWGYNVLVTDKQTSRLAPVEGNIKGAYLNNTATNGTGGIAYTSYYPFVQSARLPDGIGEISFWYRAWDSTASAIEIAAATNRLAPDAAWTVLDTLPVTNTTFRHYSRYFFDKHNRYVKLRVNNAGGPVGQAAIDNVTITAPFASDLRMRDLEIIPGIPTFRDDVFVRIRVDDLFFSPSNIVMKLYYQQGTNFWGQYLNPTIRTMALVDAADGVFTYQTLAPITARPIDVVMQYQVQAEFEGFFTTNTSPKRYGSFVTPDHYWPVDRNLGEPYPTPYYYSFSCLPGQVWINEFNVVTDSAFEPATQFIEVAGVGGVNVGGWKVEVINPDFSTNASYTFPTNRTLGGPDYGFLVLGDASVTNALITLTNALPDTGAGLQLVRSMGAIEERISYDIDFEGDGYAMSLSPDHRFLYAGADQTWTWGPNSMSRVNDPQNPGPGSNRTDFVWSNSELLTIGGTNMNQSLVPWPSGEPDAGYDGPLAITAFWRSGGRLYMTVTSESDSLSPVPWYKTNLMNSAWLEAPSPSVSVSGTTYTVSCDQVPGPKVFYKVTAE